ncbi:VOC family protein [Dyadobacter sp. CY356]|uniref:VOC family protein n=1 Tax=Dyadobacter sp. CY356 TaxID=2906442 RepID=UPI001F3A63F2|nr:VOC family protein [Dyadobacter sp. CY356]MCF0058774.1 VOC family protein [Dyadobacter sp. CY356]
MKIKELQLLTNNLDKTEAFYSAIFNVPVIQKTEKEISFSIGTTDLKFILSPVPKPVYHIAFDIPHNKLEEAFDWLSEKVSVLPVTPDSQIADIKLWNAKSIYFYDINGNLLELICRFDLDNQSEKPFDASSVISISEIGIVTDDVPALTKSITEKYNIPVFHKQPAQENFTAVGDDEGLLVLVNQNRNWFPTNEKAQSYWSKIIIEVADGSVHEIFTGAKS